MAILFNNLFGGSKPENGQLTINLNLTIKIEADGSLSVAPTIEKSKPVEMVNKVDYELPDLDVSENNLIKFGKEVK